MSCTAYRLYNGTSSPITQSFDDCNGGSCSVVVPSGATKYYITAESSTFIPDSSLTLVTTYSGNKRAFSFSSCCTNDVFHILGDTGQTHLTKYLSLGHNLGPSYFLSLFLFRF